MPDIVDEGGQVERVVTTAEHPFYRPELGRFVRAEELAAGDALLSSSGSWLKVGSATWVQQSATVYNLTVNDFQTYFVGESGVWVHNKASYRPSNTSSIVPSEGRIFSSTPQGTNIEIPGSWVGGEARNKKGIVYQRPGADAVHRDADSIRVMEPNSRNPKGYVRGYNSSGQPLDVNGKPGSDPTTHIPLDYVGPIIGWPK